MDEFCDRANERIDQLDMSMSEIARRANVGRPYLYRVLSGEQQPSLAVAARIADAIGLEFKISDKCG